jgi:plastocyanin
MPADLSVKVGDSVEFVNKDAMEHTVTLENGDFDQKLPVGGKVAYQFNDKGQFRYFCSIHPGMQGMITVN